MFFCFNSSFISIYCCNFLNLRAAAITYAVSVRLKSLLKIYGEKYNAYAALYSQIYGDLRIATKRLPIKIIDCSAVASGGEKPKTPRHKNADV